MPVTNAIESTHMQLRKIVKNRGHFPSDEAASKLLYLASRNIEKDWKMPPITSRQTGNQFAILFSERVTNQRRQLRFLIVASAHEIPDTSRRSCNGYRSTWHRPSPPPPVPTEEGNKQPCLFASSARPPPLM